MKRLSIFIIFLFSANMIAAQQYTPTPGNLEARKTFQDDKFGLFIHWGLYSLIGRGEWVLNNDKIKFSNYKKLEEFFNPEQYDPAAWVRMAKDAGMKYITFVTRHHDGFSMWDTKYSDFNIMHTPYKKDVLKMLADECHKQGIQLGLYYSLLDWGRNDYPHETGRTGQHTGRTGKGDYAHYLQFMKNQLTELLTNYGPIMDIWFDGHWDQTNPEGNADRKSRINWHYDEIYSLIHKLQPNCLIGNNHHMTPFEGEDFQMFEKDLPGQNKSGLNFQKASEHIPVEVCETMNNSWGFNLNDDHYKTVKDLVHLLVNSAGRNTNLLLNVGPEPNGMIQHEFRDTLQKIGEWMRENGQTIYGTRGLYIQPQSWGVATIKGKTLYLHILKRPGDNTLIIPEWTDKVAALKVFNSTQKVPFKIISGQLKIDLKDVIVNDTDTILEVQLR